jgi:N-acetylglutamate synthase-like GNAT family acetyltransferase
MIEQAQPDHYEDIVDTIRIANAPVAGMLTLNQENASGHTAFFTKQRLLADLKKDNRFFVCLKQQQVVGCIALRQADKHVWYINRLATLPDYQHRGIGSKLLGHVIREVAAKKGRLIKIGIIAEHESLKQWYIARGFQAGKTKTFSQLPFRVLYMSYRFSE